MTEQLLGPFTVTPTQILSLRAAFTPFVNELLRREVAAAGLSGTQIDTTSEENIGDEGVDARLTRAVEKGAIPEGTSAWQFKRGDLPPNKCRSELKEASFALEILRGGGKYRLVVGADITSAKKRNRRKALRETAEALGISLEDDAIEVLNASDLADWAQQHPSLSISHLLGSIRTDVEDFDSWAGSEGASTTWVESDAHEMVAEQVRERIEQNGKPLHIEGVSGLGKSRVVLEALRGQPYESQVVYVRHADGFPAHLVRHLASEGRTAILIVDDCDPNQRKNIVEAKPDGSQLRVITIGEPAPSRSEYPALQLPKMERHRVLEIVQVNRPGLWREAASFVTEIADGNVRLALLLARVVEKEPRSSAARLISPDIIQTYVSDALPQGTSLLACGALALLTRVGVSGDVASELRLLADALQLPENEVRAARLTLADLGMLTVTGSFLSVAPHPLAVYLATRSWEAFEDRIVTDLLPQLQLNVLERLLQRAAEVGRIEPIVRAVDEMLGRTDLFGSLSVLANGAFALRMSAIISPNRVIDVVQQLIANATDDELRDSPARQGLMWTLEKLAWESDTFERAADDLMRLAVTGADLMKNNASTTTWCALFGALLPSTAAGPKTRVAYLKRLSSSPDVKVRRLVVEAAGRMLQGRESVFDSAELQGGVAAEPRGRPETFGEVWDYLSEGLTLLRRFVDDPDPDIAASALNGVVGAIHAHLENEAFRAHFFEVLKSLPQPALSRVRAAVMRLEAYFQRVPEEARRTALELLKSELPPLSTKYEELLALLHSRTWDFGIRGELLGHVTDVTRAVISEVGISAVLDLLDNDIEASFELGHAIGELAPSGETLARVASVAGTPNFPALVGYMASVHEAGTDSIFDDFLDGDTGVELDPEVRLRLTVAGPKSEAGWRRARELAAAFPVGKAARGLIGWHTDVEPGRLAAFLRDWLDRIDNQYDYNGAILFTTLAVDSQPPWIDDLDDLIVQLVGLRRRFPHTFQESWDWSQLAKRQLEHQPLQLVQQMVAVMNEGGVYIYGMGEEQATLEQAVTQAGMPAWEFIMATLADGGRWLQSDFRGWLPNTQPVDALASWVGDDLTRARLAASVTSVKGDVPSPFSTYLLERFGSDAQVSAWLRA
ncbi:hypothetical protein [Mycobacterium sp.]|uniref:hypothetical protein n=1 Tax=Mycobacterium sp. TaxID=1785 RepID=UPI003F98A511